MFKRYRMIMGVVIAAALVVIIWRELAPRSESGAQLGRPIMSTNLQEVAAWTQVPTDLRFSTDGSAVCLSWWPEKRYGYQQHEPWDYQVFDLHGRLLARTADEDFKEVLRGFPDLAARILWPDFVKGGVGWQFTAGLSNAVRVVTNDGGGLRVEMWTLPPGKAPQWSTFVAAKGQMFFPDTFLFSTKAGPRCVVVNGFSDPVAVLDANTGNLLDSFIASWLNDSDAVIAHRARKFPLMARDPVGLMFCGTQFACAARNGVLACGSCADTRVRVIELANPHELLLELNPDASPYKVFGGLWGVERLAFLDDGRYLLAQYYLGGRNVAHPRSFYGIIETRNWREVWRTEVPAGEPLCASPDGKLIARVRDGVLEVLPVDFSTAGDASANAARPR